MLPHRRDGPGDRSSRRCMLSGFAIIGANDLYASSTARFTGNVRLNIASLCLAAFGGNPIA